MIEEVKTKVRMGCKLLPLQPTNVVFDAASSAAVAGASRTRGHLVSDVDASEALTEWQHLLQ